MWGQGGKWAFRSWGSAERKAQTRTKEKGGRRESTKQQFEEQRGRGGEQNEREIEAICEKGAVT